MVLIHMKRSEEHQFLFESTTSAQVRDVTRELVEIHNLRLRIQRLKFEGDELAQYGPIKTQDKQARITPIESTPSVLVRFRRLPTLPA